MAQIVTDAQRATFEPYVREWVRDEFCGTTVTPDDHAEAAAGMRRCYEAADLLWPDRVVWVPTPDVGEVVAVAAAAAAQRHPAPGPRRGAVVQWRRATTTWRRRQIRGFTEALVQSLRGAGIRLGPVLAGIVVGWMAGRWLGAIVGAFIGNKVGRSFWDNRSKDRDFAALCRELDRAAAELDETQARIRAAVVDPLEADLRAALGPVAADELRTRIEVPVNQAAAPVWAALAAALGTWYPDPASLRSQVEQGVRQAVPAATEACNRWMRSWWQCQPVARQHDGTVARLRWLRHHGPPLAGTSWEPFDGYAAAGRLWWWPHPEFVVVSDPPRRLHLEQVGAGAWQLHRADGPAVVWPDGPSLFFWPGVAVPGDLVVHGWDVATIHRHRNSEVRRAAIERMGWLTYISAASLVRVASAPDPGNPPHSLELYEDLAGRLGHARVLAMTNGSPHRSGRLLRYAETVPAAIDDPVEAAAWQYDCPLEVYRQLNRRT